MQDATTDKLTILDRLALGFLNACVALPTGILLWATLNGFPWAVIHWLPAISIFWFTLTMAVLGIITNNNLLVNFYGVLWHMLARWFSHGG